MTELEDVAGLSEPDTRDAEPSAVRGDAAKVPDDPGRLLPSREAIRAAYDGAIREIEGARGNQQLSGSFYRRISDAVFDACHHALLHSAEWGEQRGAARKASKAELRAEHGHHQTNAVPPRLHVISAPMGAGKTTFSTAFIVAMVRLSDRLPSMPYGCVFLVDQIPKAEAMFKELSQFLPGRIAVWTSDHDPSCEEPRRVRSPSARFYKDELKHYPVAIVTHAFFRGENHDKAMIVVRDDVETHRALTLVDEQMDDVTVYDVRLSAAARVLEGVEKEGNTELITRLHTLVQFMAEKAKGDRLEKPSDDPASWRVAEDLAWFTTTEARWYANANAERMPDIAVVFGFARCMASDYAFIVRKNKTEHGTYFVGYELWLFSRYRWIDLKQPSTLKSSVLVCFLVIATRTGTMAF